MSGWERFHRYASMMRRVYFMLGPPPGGATEFSDHCNRIPELAFQRYRPGHGPFRENNEYHCPRRGIGEIICVSVTQQSTRTWTVLVERGCMHHSPHANTHTNEVHKELHSLQITFPPKDESVPKILPPLGDTLGTPNALDTLELQSFIMLDQNVWENIQYLPSLRNLCSPYLAEPSRPAWHPTPNLGVGNGFSALTKFRCDMSYADASKLFLTHTAKSQLQEIDILIHKVAGATETYALMTEIARIAPGLRHFTMDFGRSRPALEIGVFNPILQLGNVPSLALRTRLAVDLTNDDFQLIADAVPNLQVLFISPGSISADKIPLATLEALNCIARRCPSIKSIGIYLDACTMRLPTYGTHLEQFPETLSDINFGLSICDNPLATALQLMRMLRHFHPTIRSDCRFETDQSSDYVNAQWRWSKVASSVDHSPSQ